MAAGRAELEKVSTSLSSCFNWAAEFGKRSDARACSVPVHGLHLAVLKPRQGCSRSQGRVTSPLQRRERRLSLGACGEEPAEARLRGVVHRGSLRGSKQSERRLAPLSAMASSREPESSTRDLLRKRTAPRFRISQRCAPTRSARQGWLPLRNATWRLVLRGPGCPHRRHARAVRKARGAS